MLQATQTLSTMFNALDNLVYATECSAASVADLKTEVLRIQQQTLAAKQQVDTNTLDSTARRGRYRLVSQAATGAPHP